MNTNEICEYDNLKSCKLPTDACEQSTACTPEVCQDPAPEYIGDEKQAALESSEKSDCEVSPMEIWAKREVEIACKRERGDSKDGPSEEDWDYGCACYQSALKAFRSLLEDEHSGCSIGITKQILNRLIDCRPLTEIEDVPEIWNLVEIGPKSDKKTYQCKRMSSLFKDVMPDGTVSYHDVDRDYSIPIDNPDLTYHCGLESNIVNELYPITMPYYPSGKYKVYTEECLTDPKNGDLDTKAIFYIITPTSEKIIINRFFKDSENTWIEINAAEYAQRKKMSDERRAKLEIEIKQSQPVLAGEIPQTPIDGALLNDEAKLLQDTTGDVYPQ